MSTIAMMVLFGLAVPVISFFSNVLMGNRSEEVENARAEYASGHPAAALVGVFIGFIPAIIYWVYVIMNL